MRPRHNPQLKLSAAAFFWTAMWTMSHSVHAASSAEKRDLPREHEIQQGETLGQIALEYGISLSDLMEANQLENADKIFYGQKLVLPGDPKDGVLTKAGVKLEVPRGFTINRIAALYEVSPRDIIRANKLTDPDRIREGDTLLVPGVKRVVALVPPPPCYKNAVTVYRVRTDETLEVPLEFCNGRPNTNGIKQLSSLADSISRPTGVDLHPRVLTLLQDVADHYPGKRIEIISGQRARKEDGHESYHNKGQAVDFRVEGVSNRALVAFVRSFDTVGVGYYPNSVFIHMDTREKSAYWIDYAGPGEKAIYGRKGMTKEEVDAIRERRRNAARTRTRGKLSAENEQEEKPATGTEEDPAS